MRLQEIILTEDLKAWFGKGKKGGAGGGGWDAYNGSGERIGKCGDTEGDAKPKCLSKSKAASLRAKGGKKAIGAAVKKKRRNDPNKDRKGKAKNVSNESVLSLTEEQFDEAAGEKDACYHKVKSRYKVWPSAYASGALVQCRKKGAANWGNSKKKKKK